MRDFVVSVCEDAGFGQREVANTKLAVDEACTNIIKHAYEGKTETRRDQRLRRDRRPASVSIHLRDRGKHFDFASVKDPDLDQYVETGKKGGLGVFLINRLMDGVEYRATETGNELILTKRSQAAFSAAVHAGEDAAARHAPLQVHAARERRSGGPRCWWRGPSS